MSSGREFAKCLRQSMTEEERLVWSRLRSRRFFEYKFRRQVPLGNYVVDFVCFAAKLIIELDGGQHTEQREYDSQRTAWLQSQGFRVLRYWNYQFHEEWSDVEEQIWNALNQAHPERP